jgi:tRNA(His) guanylyltransferase
MNEKKDSLGDRMKCNYELRTRYYLPRRTYTVFRLDGRSFHNYCKNMCRPFDLTLMATMDAVALKLCEEIQGCKFGYTQSDEISLVLTDFDAIATEAWFDGNIQKMASLSASIATAEFNKMVVMHTVEAIMYDAFEEEEKASLICDDLRDMKWANFDSRVFTIPQREEVVNYFSHKELQHVSCDQIQEKLFTEKNINWNDYPASFKRGRVVRKTESGWIIDRYIPVFTQDRDFIYREITVGEEE